MLAVAGASVLRPSATRAFAAEPSQPAPRLPPLGSPAKVAFNSRGAVGPGPITMPRPSQIALVDQI